MTDKERFDRALTFATKKHSGQYRIGGDEYITHPIAVARMVREKGYDTDYQIAALFHDLLEDTDATEEELLSLGNDKILHTVRLLTKFEGYTMQGYVSAIKADKMAFVIKNADRLHNLRSAFCTSPDFRKRYIAETKRWYLDFSDEIKEATENLEKSIKNN